MIDIRTPPFEIEPSKRPWPDRDWTKNAMPGRFLDGETIESMRQDSLHRDIYSEKARLAGWNLINDYHMWAREHNPGLPPDTGIYLFSAPMGKGKSHLMIAYAMMAWMFRAVPVFSSESMGAMFGYQLDLTEIYHFADTLPLGSILLVDELAALADSHSGQANRGRVMHAGLTSFRKGGSLALTATAAEAQISWQLRTAMMAVIEPYRVRPTKQITLGYDARGRPKTAVLRLRENELVYPEFCYVNARALKTPWVGRRVFEDYQASLVDNRRGKKGVDPRWKLDKAITPYPELMDLAARVYDTHVRVPISDAHAVDAGMMRAVGDRLRGSVSMDDFIGWAFQMDVFKEYAGKKTVPLKAVHEAAQAFNPMFSDTSRSVFTNLLRESVAEETISQRKVTLDGLKEAYKKISRGGRRRAS